MRALLIALAAILAAVAVFAVVRSCQPAPSNTHQIAHATPSDRLVAVTPAGLPAPSNTPVVARLAVSAGRGVITVAGNLQPVIVRQAAPAVRVVRQALSGQRSIVSETAPGPVESATVPGSDGAAMVVTSQPEPVEIVIVEPEPSRVGLIGGYLPGLVAVDVAVVRGRLLGVGVSLDVMASPLAAGAGVAVGDKLFATVGGCVEWAGRPGWYIAGGVRF